VIFFLFSFRWFFLEKTAVDIGEAQLRIPLGTAILVVLFMVGEDDIS
jgi:hypothetical protein